jgi:hypothetical protein
MNIFLLLFSSRKKVKEKLKTQYSVISTISIKTCNFFHPLTVRPALQTLLSRHFECFWFESGE